MGIRENILSQIGEDTTALELIKAQVTEELEKGGKRAQIGEIREHGGQKVQKTVDGWKPIKMDEQGKKSSYDFTEKLTDRKARSLIDYLNSLKHYNRKEDQEEIVNITKHLTEQGYKTKGPTYDEAISGVWSPKETSSGKEGDTVS